jgi:hypothetical protein
MVGPGGERDGMMTINSSMYDSLQNPWTCQVVFYDASGSYKLPLACSF